MNILAIETSTDACSVALLKDNEYYSLNHVEAKKHTQILLSMIDDLFLKAGIQLSDCNCLSFGCGPGSFTGVRIASSVIQGFGIATGIPIVPVSTLRAIAQAAYREKQERQVLAVLDARMQQFYGGLFQVDENELMQKVGEEFLKSESELQEYIKKPWIMVQTLPDAKDIAMIAQAEFKLGNTITAAEVEPIYMRNPV